jgi:hypothetical protein
LEAAGIELTSEKPKKSKRVAATKLGWFERAAHLRRQRIDVARIH